MTSIGRGRGWAKADNDSVLRRPGQSSSPKSGDSDELIERIYNDLCYETPTPQDRLDSFLDYVNGNPDISSPETIEKLWNKALDDLCFVLKLFQFYQHDHQRCSKPLNFMVPRSMLRLLQTTYLKKDEIYKENFQHFTNLTWMLGIYRSSLQGSLGRLVANALIDCLCLLLDSATEEDVELVAIQMLQLNAAEIMKLPDISDSATNLQLSDIVKKCRQTLIVRNVSARTRALLLMIIEFANNDYQPFSDDLRTFYATTLGAGKSQENDLTFRSDRDVDTQAYLYRILSRGLEIKRVDSLVETQQIDASKNLRKQQPPKVKRQEGTVAPVPRAIRGSGASDSSKDHANDRKSPKNHKPKRADKPIWSVKQNVSKSVWEHDDRFDNDYS